MIDSDYSMAKRMDLYTGEFLVSTICMIREKRVAFLFGQPYEVKHDKRIYPPEVSISIQFHWRKVIQNQGSRKILSVEKIVKGA